MKFRKGDQVSIIGIVKHTPDGDEKIFIELPDYHNDIWVKQDVVTLKHAAFEVGDRCTSGTASPAYGPGTILAICNDYAWVDLGNGNHYTSLLSELERIDVQGQSEVDPM